MRGHVHVVPHANEVNAPQFAALDNALNLSIMRSRTVLHTGLNDAVGAAGSSDHRAAFTDVVGQRFLDVYVFAGLACEDGGTRVPVVRGGDQDGVDVFTV